MATRMMATSALALLMTCSGAALATGQTLDKVKIVLPGGPDRLDPCEAPRSVIGRIIKQNVVETLTELPGDSSTVVPRLAESWSQVSPTTWRVKLRPGIKFHDGAAFDAAAVAYSFKRTLDPALTCITRTKYFGGINLTLNVVDPLTIDFTTETPSPVLPTLLAQVAIASPNTKMGEYTRTPVGTGPYAFESWTPNEQVVLKRFDGYWATKPSIQTATYVWRSESAVAAAMVATGEADLAFSIAPQDATTPATDKAYLNSDTAMFRLNVDIPPLNDVRVRKAINFAIDRKAFVGTVVSKDALPAMQQVGPTILGHNPNLKPWPYDPAGAKKLLAAAKAEGVPVNREIKLIGRGGMFANSNEFVEAVAEMLRAVGFNIKLEVLEMSQWLRIANKPFDPNRVPNIFLTMHDNNSGDAAFTAFFKYHSDGTQSEIRDPKVDQLIVDAGKSSGNERSSLYQEAFRRIYEDLVADVPLFHMMSYMRISPKIDFKPTIANAAELQLAHLKLKQK